LATLLVTVSGCGEQMTPSPSVVSSAGRSSTFEPSASVPVELDLETIPMFVLDTPLGGPADEVTVGYADGRITGSVTLERQDRRLTAASSMAGGRMAYLYSGLNGTEFGVVTVATGAVHRIELQASPIVQAFDDLVIIPDGSAVYYVGATGVVDSSGSPTIGNSTGLWRVDVAGDGVPERVLPPPTATNAAPGWLDPTGQRSRLFLTHDGAFLVVADCVDSAPCRIRSLETGTGEVRDWSGHAMELALGVSERSIVGLTRFGSRSTPIRLIDLDTGMDHEIDAIDESRFGELAVQPRGNVGAFEERAAKDAGGTTIHVIDLETGNDRLVFRNLQRVYVPGWPARIELPPDWVFLVPEACFPPPPDRFGALLNWRTGELVPLGMEEAAPELCQG
jgi:hypothetical protein